MLSAGQKARGFDGPCVPISGDLNGHALGSTRPCAEGGGDTADHLRNLADKKLFTT